MKKSLLLIMVLFLIACSSSSDETSDTDIATKEDNDVITDEVLVDEENDNSTADKEIEDSSDNDLVVELDETISENDDNITFEEDIENEDADFADPREYKLTYMETWGTAAIDEPNGVAVASDGTTYVAGYTRAGLEENTQIGKYEFSPNDTLFDNQV